MSNIDLYINIINLKKIIWIIVCICFVCIFINLIISSITNSFKNNDTIEDNSEIINKPTLIDILGAICIGILLIEILILFLKSSKYIFILFIPSYLLLFYYIYIKPTTNNKASPFKFDYYQYGATVSWTLLLFLQIDFRKSFTNIQNEGILQIITIIILLFEIYSCIYCLLINIYFVIKNLEKINIINFTKKYDSLIETIYDKFDFSVIVLTLSFSNDLVYNKNNKKLKKILLFLPCFILDIIICLFKYIFSILLSFIIKPIFSILSLLFVKLNRLINTNENQINYGITKVATAFSLVVVYIILQLNKIYQERIINTYEFISSVIIIPIILDALISLKDTLNKKSSINKLKN